MPWIQLKVDATPDQVELIEDSLLTLGAQALTLQDGADQPILEPDLGSMPIWDKTIVAGLFDAELDSAELLTKLQLMFRAESVDAELPKHKLELVEDKDWERAWMDKFHPMPFGDRLWICPSWKAPEDSNAINLMLDPGLAFGTGTHPTTALCLKWLDQVVTGNELVVDYGCGSGILGIAAILLGAQSMFGVDNDPQALVATRQNAERNQVDVFRYQVELPDKAPAELADIMVANILAGPLMSLAETLASLTKPGGHLALSGILAEQAQQVQQAYEPWFIINETAQQEDWVILKGERRSD